MTLAQWLQVPALLWQILSELRRSYRKHGNWKNYRAKHVRWVIDGELDEAIEAYRKGNRNGLHGYRAEFCQVAACSIKAVLEGN